MDELDSLMRVDPDSPLFDELMAALEAAPLPVDPAVADAAAVRLQRRLSGRRPVPWLGIGLGLAVCAAAAAAGLAILPSIGPPPEDPALDGIEAPEPTLAVEQLPEAPPDVVTAVRAHFEAGEWMAAWQAAAGVQLSEEDLRRLAIGLHGASRKDGDPATLEAASAAYEAYLAAYPAGPDDAQMRYAYAELLYQGERYAEAYDQYTVVVDRHPDSKHAEFCATSAIFAAEKLVDPDNPELDEWEERVLDASDLYLARWPESDKATAVSYRAGYLLLTNGRTDAALPHMLSVVLSAPESTEAGFAADLLVDAWGADAVEQIFAAVAGSPAEQADLLLDAFADALEEAGRAEDAAAVREGPPG